ncbi:MAG: phosphate ABC transporter ATP-binding protein [Candidatus Hydrogenedentes bacterium]|nr:phosphate ABC transporter ATP-binding protein [Candidatus Hydrogenedentota bacterium]
MTDSAEIRAKVRVRNLTVRFAGKETLRNLSLDIYPNERLAIIGPASSGKTTFLRCLNRLNDLQHTFSHTGEILLDGKDVYDPDVDLARLRRRMGMVYAVPEPLPWTIYENLVFGARLAGIRDKDDLNERVERSLKSAYLWEETKDRLHQPAHNLSGGQQQRLCLARVLALKPEVLLLDEPCSGLDPISTAKIEDALVELTASLSIVLVTNNTKQASRVSDRTAFFLMGELIEVGPTQQIFTTPAHERTDAYITGQFG